MKHKQAKSFFVASLVLFSMIFQLIFPIVAFALPDDYYDTAENVEPSNSSQSNTNTQSDEGLPASQQSTANNGPAIGDSSGSTVNEFGGGGTSIGAGDLASQSLQALGTCSIGAILSRFLTTLVGVLVNEIIGKIKNAITDTVDNLLTLTAVPVADNKTRKNTCAQALKTTGICHTTITGLIDWIGNVSLDSIMFCIINEILTYVTEATIAWINSGFNGNPVYVQNPSALFQQVADREVSYFAKEVIGQIRQAEREIVNGVANGVAQGIINIAEPLRQGAVRAIVGQGSGLGHSLSPDTLSNYNAYVSGKKWPGFQGFMEIANNNYYETNMRVIAERDRRVAAEQYNQQLQLQYSNGYRTPTVCPEEHMRQDGTCKPTAAQTTAPYRAIGDEVQARASMKYLRVAVAKDFDSVVTALVNQLVKIAVNKIYEGAGNLTN